MRGNKSVRAYVNKGVSSVVLYKILKNDTAVVFFLQKSKKKCKEV